MIAGETWERLGNCEEFFRHISRVFFCLVVILACMPNPWRVTVAIPGVICWAVAIQTATLASCARQLRHKQAAIDMLTLHNKGKN